MAAHVLAADVGGTKTDIAIFSSTDTRNPVARATYQNDAYDGIEPIAREFLAQTHQSVEAACIDVAGPVLDGRAMVTNLPWIVTESGLRAALQIDAIRLVNDLEATAVAVPLLQAADLRTLSAGKPQAHGPVGVVAVGTGLGEAYLTWDGQRYLVSTSARNFLAASRQKAIRS